MLMLLWDGMGVLKLDLEVGIGKTDFLDADF